MTQDGNTLFASGTGNGGTALSLNMEDGTLNWQAGFGRPGSAARSKLAAFDEATGALEPWAPTVNTALGIEAVGADLGRVAVGGEFTRISGVNVNHFARFQE